MKEVAVHFANGRDVLNAYWGFLASGGLTIARDNDAQELSPGQDITLHVHIGMHRVFAIRGKVMLTQSRRAFIAFAGNESQNRLLAAALSERPIDLEARITVSGKPSEAVSSARLFELSEDGCCLRLSSESGTSFAVGTEIAIEANGFRIEGCVVSACECERCILFSDESDIEAVRAYVQAPGH